MMKQLYVVATTVLMFVASVRAYPTLIQGDFSATPRGQSFEEIGEFSGTFSLYLDFNLASGAAFERIRGIQVSSLSVSPSPIDGVVYDPENTSATAVFKYGELSFLEIGGAVNGVPLCSAATDDFCITYVRSGNTTLAAYEAYLVTRDDSGIGTDFTPFGNATIVPEPTTILLFALGGGLLLLRCTRNKINVE